MIEKVQQQIIVDDLGTAVIIHPETSSDNVLHQGGTLDELITLDQKRKRNFNFMGNKVVQDGLMGAYQNVTTKLDTGIIADDYFIAIDFIFNGNTSVGQPILGNIGVGGGCYFQARANTGNFSFNPNDGSIVDSGVKVNIGNNKLLMSVNKSKVVFLLNGEIKSYDVSINTSNRNIVFLSPSSVSSSISTQIIIRNATIYNRQLTPQEIQHNFTVLNNSPSINTLHAGDKKLLLSTDTDHVTDRAGRTQEQINRRFYKRNCKEFTSTGGAITVNNAEEGYVLSAEIKGQTVKNYALTNNTEKTITATGAVICPTMQVPTQTLVTLAFIAKDVMDDTFIRIAFDGGYIVDNTNRRVSNGLNLIPVTLNVTQGKTGLYMGTFNGTFKANNFMILDGDARGKINSYIPFGLSSTQAILSNSGSLYPIYEPFIVGKTRILTPEGATVETGLVPTDPTLPALKDGDKLDLATRVITFANATTRQLTEEEVKAYRNFKKDINIVFVGDVNQEEYAHLTTPQNKQIDNQNELVCYLHGQLRDGIYKDIFTYVVDEIQHFKLAPAAISNHHNYAGGLLQHSLEVAMIAYGIYQGVRKASLPIDLNPDLLIVGAFLHDLGKVKSYSFKGLAIDVAGVETLTGHLVQGAGLIEDIAHELGFDRNCQQVILLQHILLSHHGKLEYGSPVKPCIPEAMIVHQADMLSFQLTVVNEAKAQENSDWTTPIYTLDGARIFKGVY